MCMSLGLIAILKMSPCLNIAGPILFNRFTEAGPILAALISALYTQIYQPVCTQSPQRKVSMPPRIPDKPSKHSTSEKRRKNVQKLNTLKGFIRSYALPSVMSKSDIN